MNASILPLPAISPCEDFPAPSSPGAESLPEQDLITLYLPMVRTAVDRFKLALPAHVDADDLHSAGVAGLLAAVSKFDASRGRTFAGYVAMRVRGAILDELRRMDWCPRRTRAKMRKLSLAVNSLEQKLGRPATEEETCAELGINARDYGRLVAETTPISFVPIDRGWEGQEMMFESWHEKLADDNALSGRDEMLRSEMTDAVAERIAALPERQRKILAMHYHERMRISEIAAAMGVSESRICQIHAKTLRDLRVSLRQAA